MRRKPRFYSKSSTSCVIVARRSPKDYRHGGLVPTAIKGALDISRARAELGYEPKYDIQKGIVRPGTFDHTILDGWTSNRKVRSDAHRRKCLICLVGAPGSEPGTR
jgi:hypothetical protein